MPDDLAMVYADGGSRGNPGPSGCGFVIKVDGKVVVQLGKFLGETTNNVAEYMALILALEKALELGYKRVQVRMDSELIVKQMLGLYRVKNENLLPLSEKAQSLLRKFAPGKIEHIRRQMNKEADRLANLAMDAGADVNASEPH